MFIKILFFITLIISFLRKGCGLQLNNYQAENYKLSINKYLDGGIFLEESLWSTVDYGGICIPDTDKSVLVTVEMPLKIYEKKPSVYVFIANNDQNILQITFKKELRYTLYKTPYNVEKDISDLNLRLTFSSLPSYFSTASNSAKITARFPASYLPENSTKVSAGMEFPNDPVLNYYGIKNYKISIPDFMVLEEYKILNC